MIEVTCKDIGRGNSFSRTVTILNNLTDKPNIIEIGTSRGNLGGGPLGDGWATRAWGWYCKNYGGHIYTVDIDIECIEQAKLVTEDFKENITYAIYDGAAFIEQFEEKIDLLYLDGADDPHQMLDQYNAAKNKMNNRSLILLDDIPQMWDLRGKGSLAIPRILNDGWSIIYHDTSPTVNQMLLCNY